MIVPNFSAVGGAEQQLKILVKSLKMHDLEVDLLSKIDQSSSDGFSRILTVQEYRQFWKLGFIVKLLSEGWRYQVFHCHTFSGISLLVALVGLILRKPVVIKVPRSGKGGPIERWVKVPFARSIFRTVFSKTCFICLTEVAKSEMLSLMPFSNHIKVIPNGVELPTTHIIEEQSEHKIVVVGRLIQRKRVDLLIRTLAKLRERPGWHCHVVGDGPEFGHLFKLSAELGLTNRMTFEGQLAHHEVDRLRVSESIFVLPSLSEGMSNSLLEAMAHGLCPLVADIPENREALSETGMFFKDEKSLLLALEALISSKGLRKAISEAVTKRCIEKYGITSTASSYSGLYRQLCGEK